MKVRKAVVNKRWDIRLFFDKEMLEKIRAEADKDKRTMTNFVTKLVIDYIQQIEQKENLIKGE
jgi:replicative DNA helicase